MLIALFAPLFTALLASGSGVALAQEEEAQTDDVPQQRFTDFTAYTVERRQWRVGISELSYGLVDNVSVGTSPLFLVVGPNARAKVQAVELDRLAFSLEGSYYAPYDFWLQSIAEGDGVSAITMQVTPIAWKGSDSTLGGRMGGRIRGLPASAARPRRLIMPGGVGVNSKPKRVP